jgi:CopG family nickel-responsive transcriptional regulator
VSVVSSSTTERLRDDLDTSAGGRGYTGRVVIREACRSPLEEYRGTDDEGRRVVATATPVFGDDEPRIERRMMDSRREFEASLGSNTHGCLGGNAGCVETSVIEAADDDALRRIGTVRRADESVSVVPVDVVSAEIASE